MSEPLTMSAEREAEIQEFADCQAIHPLDETLVELKAERAAHKRTQEASTMYAKALSTIGDDCEKLREQLRHSREVSTALRAALKKITEMLSVGHLNGAPNIPQIEINGVPVYRPLEPANREDLGTLFTHLFNAHAAIALAERDSNANTLASSDGLPTDAVPYQGGRD